MLHTHLLCQLLNHQLGDWCHWQVQVLLDVIQLEDGLLLEAESQVLEDLLVADQLLNGECSNGNHCQAAVVELLGLDVLPGSWVILGGQVQGVKAASRTDVSRQCRCQQQSIVL